MKQKNMQDKRNEQTEILKTKSSLVLPNEILLIIALFLNIKSLCLFIQVCKQTSTIAEENQLWEFLFKKEFGDQSSLDQNIHRNTNLTWKDKCKIKAAELAAVKNAINTAGMLASNYSFQGLVLGNRGPDLFKIWLRNNAISPGTYKALGSDFGVRTLKIETTGLEIKVNNWLCLNREFCVSAYSTQSNLREKQAIFLTVDCGPKSSKEIRELSQHINNHGLNNIRVVYLVVVHKKVISKNSGVVFHKEIIHKNSEVEAKLKNYAEDRRYEFFSIDLTDDNLTDHQKQVDGLISEAVKKYALTMAQEKATSPIEQTAEDKPGRRCLIS
jgi:hypothetical protein